MFPERSQFFGPLHLHWSVFVSFLKRKAPVFPAQHWRSTNRSYNTSIRETQAISDFTITLPKPVAIPNI
jgi:hypothetical protein